MQELWCRVDLLKTELDKHRKDVDNTNNEKYTRSWGERLMYNFNNCNDLKSHNRLEGAKIIDKMANKRTRQVKEAIWIRKTKNRDEDSYELPHLYDDVIRH